MKKAKKPLARRVLTDTAKRDKVVVTFDISFHAMWVHVVIEGRSDRYRVVKGKNIMEACVNLGTELQTFGGISGTLVSEEMRNIYNVGRVGR